METEILVSIGILLILLGNVFRKNPTPYPSRKQREYLKFGFKIFICGYISKRALKNEKSWNYANSFFGKRLVILGVFELLLLISLCLISRCISLKGLPKEQIVVCVLIAGFICSIIHTEVKLSQLFDEC